MELTLLLLEASLETIPNSIANHPTILKQAAKREKKPTDLILDISLHYHAMRKLPRMNKRGRPDIVHLSLLEALESPLNKKQLLRVIVHTIGGHAIFINPNTRLPKNYNRFIGLVEQLFRASRVPPNGREPLIYLKTIPLRDLLKELSVNGLIILSEKCNYKPLSEIVKQALRDKLAIGIGAFPHGDFEEDTLKQANYCYSIYNEPLTTHIVVSRVISAAEKAVGIFEI